MPSIPNAALFDAIVKTGALLDEALEAVAKISPNSIASTIQGIAPNANDESRKLLEASIVASEVLANQDTLHRTIKIFEEEVKALTLQENVHEQEQEQQQQQEPEPEPEQQQDNTNSSYYDQLKEFGKNFFKKDAGKKLLTAFSIVSATDDHASQSDEINKREQAMKKSRHYEHHIDLITGVSAALAGYTRLSGLLPFGSTANGIILPAMIVAAGAKVAGYTLEQAAIKSVEKAIDKIHTPFSLVRKEREDKTIAELITGRDKKIDKQLQSIFFKEKADFAELTDRNNEMRATIRKHKLDPERYSTADNLRLLQEELQTSRIFCDRLEEHVHHIEKLKEQRPDYPDIDSQLLESRRLLAKAQYDGADISKQIEDLPHHLLDIAGDTLPVPPLSEVNKAPLSPLTSKRVSRIFREAGDITNDVPDLEDDSDTESNEGDTLPVPPLSEVNKAPPSPLTSKRVSRIFREAGHITNDVPDLEDDSDTKSTENSVLSYFQSFKSRFQSVVNESTPSSAPVAKEMQQNYDDDHTPYASYDDTVSEEDDDTTYASDNDTDNEEEDDDTSYASDNDTDSEEENDTPNAPDDDTNSEEEDDDVERFSP